MERRLVHFGGTVQGVGFRVTTQRLARRRGLSGWVRNLPDGRVAAEAQGPSEAIDKLLSELRAHFGEGVQSVESEAVPLADDSDGFVVRR